VEEIKTAFRSKIQKVHPDRGGSPEVFQQVREAYEDALKETHSAEFDADSPRRGSWSMQDFARWRREQLAEDETWFEGYEQPGQEQQPRPEDEDSWVWSRWQDAAEEGGTDLRSRWASSEQRRRQEEEHQRSEDQAERMQEQEREEATRYRKSGPVYGPDGDRVSDHWKNMSTWGRVERDKHTDVWGNQWKDYYLEDSINRFDPGRYQMPKVKFLDELDEADSRQRRADADDEAAKVVHLRVGYRTIKTVYGDTRVPVFEDQDGMRYYKSPVTKKRISLPR
jgi:curved DNA-binding protein CbpA